MNLIPLSPCRWPFGDIPSFPSWWSMALVTICRGLWSWCGHQCPNIAPCPGFWGSKTHQWHHSALKEVCLLTAAPCQSTWILVCEGCAKINFPHFFFPFFISGVWKQAIILQKAGLAQLVHSIMLQLFGNEYKLFFFYSFLPTRINKYDTHLRSLIVNSKAQVLTLQLNFTAICTVYYFDFLLFSFRSLCSFAI